MRRKWIRRLAEFFLYVAVIGFLLPLFFIRPGVYEGPAAFPDMIYGKAARPFVYRTIMPSIVRALTIVSERAFGLAGMDLSVHPISRFGNWLMRATGAPETAMQYSHEYGICALVIAACFIGFARVLRRLILHFYPEYPRFVSHLAPILGLMVIPLLFFRYGNHMYDPMTLLVFTLSGYLIAKRRHLLYLAVFPLASLNKETAILLVLVFLVREAGVMPRRRLVLLSLWQLLSFVLIKSWLTYAFRGNPGSFVELHLLDHNVMLLGAPGFYLKTLAVVRPVAILVGHGWSDKPLFLRCSLVFCSVPLLTLAIFFGFVDELRGYYELYPFVLLLVIPTVVQAFGIDTTPTRGRIGDMPRLNPASSGWLPG